MRFQVEIPYTRSEKLPSCLPTVKDIEESATVLKDGIARRVVIVGDHYVVKYGNAVTETEGHNLIFAEQHLSIPVPRTYAIFKDDDGRVFIVMERIIGYDLQSVWSSLPEEVKTMAMSKLKIIIEKMRDFHPNDPQFFGSIAGEYVPYHLFWTKPRDASISGPFFCEHDFNMGLVAQLRDIWAQNGKHSYRADYFAAHLGDVLHSHCAVFTHADIQRKNIMIRHCGNFERWDENDFELVIVDWADAGWYPEYWEYFSAFVALTWDDDWPTKLELAVRPWTAEVSLMSFIYKDLWF